MSLTPSEQLQRRLTDPYYGIAESVSGALSLSVQKSAALAAASVEKNRRLDPVAAAADELRLIDEENARINAARGDYLDLIESSFYKSRENLFDAISGHKSAPGVDRNQQIQEFADFQAGINPAGREELVGRGTQAVVDNVAGASLALDQGNFLEAAKHGVNIIGEAAKVSPGIAAESVVSLLELGAGVGLTAYAPTRAVGKPLLAKKVKDTVETIGKFSSAVQKAKKALTLKNAAKAASQVSIVTLDQVKSQLNDFKLEHGVDATRGQTAQMVATTMMSFMLDPTIIKHLFVPKFRKELGKEIRNVGKNLGPGSNFKSIVSRLFDGTKKVLAATGAEAGQEYFQTLVEELNVGMGPEQRKEFMASLAELVTSEDVQLKSFVGGFLGAGAGGFTRLAIAAPGLAVGTALDTTKGTAKVAAKTAVGGVKFAAKVSDAFATKAGFALLSQSDRDQILSQHASEKAGITEVAEKINANTEVIETAETMAELREAMADNPELAEIVNGRLESADLTDPELDDESTFKAFKKEVLRTNKGQVAILETQLATSKLGALAKRIGENVQAKSVQIATDAIEAVAPNVEELVTKVTEFGEQAVAAVKEIESSTGLGMIEIALKAGGKLSRSETKRLLTAAKGLEKADVVRVRNVVGEFNDQLARKLNTVIKSKDKTLLDAGIRSKDIVNEKTISKVITDAKGKNLSTREMKALSIEINKAVNSVIDDQVAQDAVVAATDILENSPEFKNQVKGIMTPSNMKVVRQRLAKSDKRVKDLPLDNVDKVVRAATKAADAVSKVAKKAAEVGTPIINDAIDATVDKANEVVEDTKEALRAENATKPVELSDKFRAISSQVEKTLADPVEAKDIIAEAETFITLMRKNGIENRSQFLAFIAEFPGLESNAPFFEKLNAAYPTDLVTDEVIDFITTKALNAVDSVEKSYNKMSINKECKA